MGENGVKGTFGDDVSGYLKETYNSGLGVAQLGLSAFPALGAFSQLIPSAEIAPTEALGAALFEGLSFAAGGIAGVESAFLKSVSRLATKSARGLSRHGGILSSTTNSAGGEVITSVGKISQNDFAPFVNSGLFKGDVNIISGVHGERSGLTRIDKALFDADVARFGNIPGVKVFNLPDLTKRQITDLLRSPGTTIGGFCDSSACLAPFR